ncbi:MAG: SH3 domain-containing protein [Hyphomicrobiaceae bacterium]
MRSSWSIFIFAATLTISFSGVARATSEGTCFDVVNVPPGDVLNLRADPNGRARIVMSTTAQDGPIIALDGKCRGSWCRVSVSTGDGTLRGWMHTRYLRAKECP